jgi:hypothetical protein
MTVAGLVKCVRCKEMVPKRSPEGVLLSVCDNCGASPLASLGDQRRYPSHGQVYDSRVDWPERHRGDGPI